MSLKIADLLEEFDIELTDLRWFLSIELADRLLTYHQEPLELAELIWKGSLESDMYDMEEKFIRDSQDLIDRGLLDEARIREQLSQVIRSRRLKKR